jgi:hypothetical protein
MVLNSIPLLGQNFQIQFNRLEFFAEGYEDQKQNKPGSYSFSLDTENDPAMLYIREISPTPLGYKNDHNGILVNDVFKSNSFIHVATDYGDFIFKLIEDNVIEKCIYTFGKITHIYYTEMLQ